MTTKKKAPEGDLSTYACESFAHGGVVHPVYRKGSGPAVLVITEMPGISPQVLGFADRLVALGFSVALPQLFGVPGFDAVRASAPARLRTAARVLYDVCVSREFTMLATGRSSPVVDWLRALAVHEHERCGGPGVGAIGMCFTGGFALAMATEPRVLVPVLSQPSLPLGLTARQRRTIDCGPRELATVADRCARDGLRVLGLRFHGDPLVPAERFAFLRERLGDGFIAVELDQRDGHPEELLKKHHSVLTGGLVDEPGEPTHAAQQQVLTLLQRKLLPARTSDEPSSA
ncbi:dienelactone hydrolase family protein [Nannocystis radixulma]|uniref:Dienelactone hydrolase family protein n=1 Tax=Nannocystis radixulma TaxID=2995305 RepID=A0ABT5BF16_9BACT|nr:dienelactone hydrolase family protein [Nannocystis radixulma]MDC0672735.1 dienelactone hydrolase family protein [Nannocystis radixulma]